MANLKKLLFATLPLLPAAGAFAQSAHSDSLYHHALSLFESAHYEDAISAFRQVQQLDSIEAPDDQELYGSTGSWIAHCQYKLGNADKAKALEPFFYELTPVNRDLTKASRENSSMAISATSIDMAIFWTKLCADEESKALGENHHYLFNTWCNLADLAMGKGDEAACRDYIAKANSVARHIATTDSAWKSYPMAMEAELEFGLEHYDRAVGLANKVWDMNPGKLSINAAAYSSAVKILLNNLFQNKQFEAADDIAAIAAGEYMSLHDDLYPACYDLAFTLCDYYTGSMQTSKALPIIEKAIATADSDELRAEMTFSRGIIHKTAGEMPEAVADILSSIEIFKKVNPKNQEYLARQYFALGECYDYMRDFDKCEEAYNLALRGFRKQGLPALSGQLQTIHHLGSVATRYLHFDKGLKYLEECLDMMRRFDAGKPMDFAFLNKERGNCYQGSNRFPEAIDCYREAIEIYEQNNLPLNDQLYFEAASNLSWLLLTTEDNDIEAQLILDRLDSIYADENIHNKRMRALLLNARGKELKFKGRHQEALEAYLKCRDITEETENFQISDLDVSILTELTVLGKMEEAREMLRRSTEIAEERFGHDSREYLSALMMGGIFMNSGCSIEIINEMNDVGDEIIDITSKIYSKDDPEYSNCMAIGAKMKALTHPQDASKILTDLIKSQGESRLAANPNMALFIYVSLCDISRNGGFYDKAVGYGEKALNYIATSNTNDEIASLYSTLGQAYASAGMIAKAEDALLKAIKYAESSNGGLNANAFLAYRNLAALYLNLGRSDKYNDFNAKARTIYQTMYADNEIMQVYDISNNIWTKYEQGDKDGCLADLERIESLYSSIKLESNADMSLPSRLKAIYWEREGELDLADLMAQKALMLSRTPDNLSMNAEIAFQKQNFPLAKALCDENLNLIKSVAGNSAVETIAIHRMLGDIALKLSNPAEASLHYRAAFDNSTRYIYDNLLSLTAEQRAGFWAQNRDFYRTYLPSLCRQYDVDADMAGLLYDASLFANSLLLNADKSIIRAVQNAGEEVRNTYAEWNAKKDMLMKLSASPESGSEDVRELADEVARLEKSMLSSLRQSGADTERLTAVGWQKVKKALPKGAAAVEFIDFKVNDDSYAGLAVVVTRDSRYPAICKLYARHADDDLQPDDFDDSADIGDRIWSGASKALDGVSDIYFTPQGPLCSLPLESIETSDGVLPAGVSLHRLSSTAELVYAPRKRRKEKAATLYGGLLYDTDISTLRAEADKYPELRSRGIAVSDLFATRASRQGAAVIPYLKGSKAEVDAVSGFMRSSAGLDPRCLIGAQGTESSVKAFSGRYGELLHISTHGFFLSPEKTPAASGITAEDLALRNSGLLMAGAQNKLNGSDNLPDDIDDGILTASEIADLDLSGVNLAVLSACETGLGQITADGVFGLQRGLKKAGAGPILMSLWKVDDDATCHLISEFYRNLLGDPKAGIKPATKNAALEAAKASVRSNPKWKSPYFWAPFILLDALD